MCNSPEVVHAVVPTVAVPLATIMFVVNALVSWVASLFGVKLDWGGPRNLLRALLRPRVVAGIVLFNILTIGIVYGWRQTRTLPSPLLEIQWMNTGLQHRFGEVGAGRTYTNTSARVHEVERSGGDARVDSVSFRQIWRVSTGAGQYGAAAIAGDSVFVGSLDGYVYEFDQAEGKLLRRFFIGTEISPDPVIWKNRLFVGEGTHEMRHARMYAFDLTSGSFVGAVQTKGHTEGTPLIAHDDRTGRDHLLFVAGADGIYSVDPITLKEQWHFVGGHTDSDPRVLGGRVYFSTGVEKGDPHSRHTAYALDLATGGRIWSTEMPASGWMPGAFIGHQICFGIGEIYVKSSFGQLGCYDVDTGKPGPAMNADAPVLSVPLRVGNHVVVADRDGEVCDMQFPEGARAWCHATHGETNASLTYLAPGVLVYPSATEGLLAFEPEEGRQLASWKPSPAEGGWTKTNARAIASHDGSTIYLTDESGTLRKIEAQVTPRQAASGALVGAITGP